MKKDVKRHCISAVITFVTGFLLGILPNIDQFTPENIKNGVIVGILASAFRAALKVTIEYVIPILTAKLGKSKEATK